MFFRYLFGIVILAIFYSVNKKVYENYLDEDYFEGQIFANNYMYSLREEVRSLIYNTNEPHFIGKGGTRIFFRFNTYNFLSDLQDCKFLIIHNGGNKVYTNVEDYDFMELGEIRDYIQNLDGKKFYVENGSVKTDSKILQEQWENYKDMFQGAYYYTQDKYLNSEDYEKATMDALYNKVSEKIEQLEKEQAEKGEGASVNIDIVSEATREKENVEQSMVYVDYDISDFSIYVSYKEQLLHSSYDAYILNILQNLQGYEDIIYVSVPICGILTVVIITYLIMSIGYKKNKEGIELNDIDKIPLEIVFAVLIGIIILLISITVSFTETRYDYYKLFLSEIITAYAVIYILSAITLTTIIKRIKAKTIIKNTITWRLLKICRRMWKKVKKAISVFTERISITWRVILISIIYLLIMIIVFFSCINYGSADLAIISDIAITIGLIYYIIKRLNCYRKIEEQLKKIYEGNNKDRLNEEEFTKEFKEVARYINDISNGFENAVEEGIKSERLKTELITNVSHDIKTPLTSIINYADLIKQENIENDKVREYVDILLSKSHRLKRLTEDLVEASKVSSGNVKLNLENINIIELINQTTGEFEDKFNEKSLKLITDMPKEDIFVEADSRYMYRIIENIFSNIAKYALENSRVYIDMTRSEDRVKIEIKNISQDKLNISEEELMQRFVRGDKSRTTEGSGLRSINFKKFSRASKRQLQYTNRRRPL